MVKLRLVLFVAACAAALKAQTFALSPDFTQQYFTNTGQPLGLGFIVTCVAGTTCTFPTVGTPQPTWTDASGSTQNQNPVPLDANGRASIWLDTTKAYKFVLVTNAGVVIKTVDNVTAAAGGIGPVTNYWTLSGSTISNNNGAGAGTVQTGSDIVVGGNATITGAVKMASAASGGKQVSLAASNGMAASVTWRWPATDLAGCLSSDGAGNLSFSAACGTGSGGAAGPTTSVQFNNGGALAGSSTFVWSSGSNQLTVAGIFQANGTLAGFNAPTALAYNAVQAPAGGMAALSFTAVKYIQAGNSAGVPTATGSDTFHAGALYWDTGSAAMQVYNGAAWVSLGGGAGSPGGANTNVQFNSSGAFGGSANFVWTGTVLGVTGTVQANGATGGFNANGGTAYNAVQAASGGMAANSFTAVKYIQAGNSAGAPSPTASDAFHAGALYWDTGSAAMQVYNGAAWVSLGGGAGSPGGANTNVQFNSSGAFGGSANFVWTGTVLGVTGVVQANGASGGFNANGGTAYNAIQASSGGAAARSFTATTYVQSGTGASDPTVTASDTFHAGALYYNSTSNCEMVYNGASFNCIGGGTGTPGGANTNVQFNSSGTFGGTANLTWNNATQQLGLTTAGGVAGITVAGGYIQSAQGLSAPAATAFNTVQVPSGGMLARSFTASTYVQTGSGSSNPTPTTSDTINAGALYYNTVSACETVYNGAAWVCIGGAGSTPGGPNTSVQFNNSGAFGGTTNFEWTNTAPQSLTITTSANAQGLHVVNGYTTSDAGFLVNISTSYNSVQSPGGGMAARSFTSTSYVQTGNSAGSPGLTAFDSYHRGALYFDTSLGVERLCTIEGCGVSGSTTGWVTLASGGVTSVNALSGALNIVGTANQVNVSSVGSTITLSTPQNISTGSTPTFAGVVGNGAFNSTSTGFNVAFQTSNSNFSVNGNGALTAVGAIATNTGLAVSNTALNSIQTTGNINACTSAACQFGEAYSVTGSTVINSAAQFVGAAVLATGNVQAGGVFAVNGGFFGRTADNTGVQDPPISVAGCTLFFRGGILYGHSGC